MARALVAEEDSLWPKTSLFLIGFQFDHFSPFDIAAIVPSSASRAVRQGCYWPGKVSGRDFTLDVLDEQESQFSLPPNWMSKPPMTV